MSVYLDYNATTPIDADVQRIICTALENSWGNPSSSYDRGSTAKKTIDEARKKVATMVGASADEIIFTSGGTESNNMVIYSCVRSFHAKDDCGNDRGSKAHIITTNVEHDSVKLPLKELSKEGKIDVTFVPVSMTTGAVVVEDILAAIRPNTCLISVMLANNETGIIQPVHELRPKLKDSFPKDYHRILLHTDAAQAIGKINVDVNGLDVDYLTIVGHKFYGPRIGALYFKRDAPIHPIFYGGGQEKNLRPGTENTCMIAGLGYACELVSLHLDEYTSHMEAVRNHLEKCLEATFPNKVVFHSRGKRLPNTVSVAFDYNGINGQDILAGTLQISAGTGAACHSDSKMSNILLASGVTAELASKTLRLSVGRETTEQDVVYAVQCLHETIKRLGVINSNCTA